MDLAPYRRARKNLKLAQAAHERALAARDALATFSEQTDRHAGMAQHAYMLTMPMNMAIESAVTTTEALVHSAEIDLTAARCVAAFSVGGDKRFISDTRTGMTSLPIRAHEIRDLYETARQRAAQAVRGTRR